MSADIEVMGELVRIARELVSGVEPSALNGMSKREAKKFVNGLLSWGTKGFFTDDNWRPVHDAFKRLRDHGVDYTLTKAEYRTSRDREKMYGHGAMPDAKEWKFEIEFENERGRPATLYGIIVASGAGSVEDPLDRYDIVAYVS